MRKYILCLLLNRLEHLGRTERRVEIPAPKREDPSWGLGGVQQDSQVDVIASLGWTFGACRSYCVTPLVVSSS